MSGAPPVAKKAAPVWSGAGASRNTLPDTPSAGGVGKEAGGSQFTCPAHVAGDAPGKTGVEADRVMVGVPEVLEGGAVELVTGPPACAATAGKSRPMCAATTSGVGVSPGGDHGENGDQLGECRPVLHRQLGGKGMQTKPASSKTTLRCATAKPRPRSGNGAAARCGGT